MTEGTNGDDQKEDKKSVALRAERLSNVQEKQ